MNRRNMISYISKMTFLMLFCNYRISSLAQSTYTQKIVSLPYPIYTCDQIIELIKEKNESLQYLKDNQEAEIGHIKKNYQEKAASLKQYHKELNAAYDKKKIETVLSYISLIVSVVLGAVLVVPAVTASTGAVASIFAIQIIGGTAFTCYQAIKLGQANEVVMFSYTKDRVSTFTTILTHQTQSSAGKIFSKIISFLSLALDLYSSLQNTVDLVSQKSKIDRVVRESNEISTGINRLSLIQWYQLQKFALQNSINGLQKILEQSRANNCAVGSALLLFPPIQLQP